MPPAEERAQRLTDKLKEQLGLTEEQVSKVAEINLRTAKQTAAIMNSPGEGRRARAEELRREQGGRGAWRRGSR